MNTSLLLAFNGALMKRDCVARGLRKRREGDGVDCASWWRNSPPVSTYSPQGLTPAKLLRSSPLICKDQVCKWRRWRPQILVDADGWSMAAAVTAAAAAASAIIQPTNPMTRAVPYWWWSSAFSSRPRSSTTAAGRHADDWLSTPVVCSRTTS